MRADPAGRDSRGDRPAPISRRARIRHALGVHAAAALLVCAAAAPAIAATYSRPQPLEIGFEDERLLLGDPQGAPGLLAQWSALGVKVVRLHAQWWTIAPQRRPPGFRAADPADPHYDWTALDRAVASVRAAGLTAMLTVTGPGPLWTSGAPARQNARWEPSPTEFGRFAHAVAARYRDQVDRYLVWNEPNQPGWLQPQNACVGRVCTPVAPHLYRALVRAAVPQIHTADPGSQVLLGELAPVGSPLHSRSSPIAPLPFLRAMACVDARYRPLHGGPCAGFKPAAADAFGYHPHPKLHAPDQPNPNRDEAQIADLGRLLGVLDRLKGRLDAPGGVYLTEFGYQTSPPDLVSGISLPLQARYLQQASYIAWRNPRIRSLSFYQWDDEPVLSRGRGTRAYSGWQSGLRFVTGRAKPALSTFQAPFVIDLRARVAWGQVRPAASPVVTLMERPPGATTFQDVAQATTGADGSFALGIAPDAGASYEYRWTPAPTLADPMPAPRLSGIVDLSVPQKTSLRAATAPAQ